ncbi:MAG: aromatic ring-hydroxylating dioxygenase subunit alpha [Xanthomonadaceae bacterium]|nr:aromatic ring-hydroxylating dioxygenase subunit alpha [Xanthomonadaceae bacterium]
MTAVPLDRARTPPSAWYTDPRMHDHDRDALLARTWQYCGAASALAEPGSSLHADVAGRPVVFVNDPETGVRAFYSVCQHRGGPVGVRCGQATFFQCRYHGWTYNLDGSLRGTPQFERGPSFDPGAHGLKPVRHAEWGGLLFACTDPDAPDLDEFVAGIDALVAPLTVDGKAFHMREVYPVNCNWKVYVDNYLEAYHLPHVHPEYARTLDYAGYREELHGWWSVQRGRLEGDTGYYGALGEGVELFYLMVWPNLMLNLAAGRLQVNMVRPLAHDRCEVLFDYYYADSTSDAARAAIAEDSVVSARIQAEDAEICERVHQGLASPAYDSGCYSAKREQALHHYHNLLREWYGKSGVPV